MNTCRWMFKMRMTSINYIEILQWHWHFVWLKSIIKLHSIWWLHWISHKKKSDDDSILFVIVIIFRFMETSNQMHETLLYLKKNISLNKCLNHESCSFNRLSDIKFFFSLTAYWQILSFIKPFYMNTWNIWRFKWIFKWNRALQFIYCVQCTLYININSSDWKYLFSMATLSLKTILLYCSLHLFPFIFIKIRFKFSQSVS